MTSPDMLMGLGVLATFSAVIMTAAKVHMRKMELQHRDTSPLDAAVHHRLERIEQAVEAIALEMERVSEGQRFTTKLLSERSPEPHLPPSDPTPR